MRYKPRFHVVGGRRLPAELEELGCKLAALPEPVREELVRLCDGVMQSFRLRSRITNVAREALERMRLEVAYLQFDLDLTRRENQLLRKQMEDDRV